MLVLSVLVLAVPPPASAAPVPTDGLVSLWDFQEASGPFVAKLGAGHYALEATDYMYDERRVPLREMIRRASFGFRQLDNRQTFT
jgi:hypothetical protein